MSTISIAGALSIDVQVASRVLWPSVGISLGQVRVCNSVCVVHCRSNNVKRLSSCQCDKVVFLICYCVVGNHIFLKVTIAADHSGTWCVSAFPLKGMTARGFSGCYVPPIWWEDGDACWSPHCIFVPVEDSGCQVGTRSRKRSLLTTTIIGLRLRGALALDKAARRGSNSAKVVI